VTFLISPSLVQKTEKKLDEFSMNDDDVLRHMNETTLAKASATLRLDDSEFGRKKKAQRELQQQRRALDADDEDVVDDEHAIDARTPLEMEQKTTQKKTKVNREKNVTTTNRNVDSKKRSLPTSASSSTQQTTSSGNAKKKFKST
jgi:hypothetical protein